MAHGPDLRTGVIGAVAVFLLGMAGVWMLWQQEPSPAAPTARATPPTVAPERLRPGHGTAPRVVFQRSVPRPDPAAPVEHLPAGEALPEVEPATEHPPSKARSMDDLGGDRKQAFIQSGLENLRGVMDACQDQIDVPLQVMARSTLDARGLIALELSTYEMEADGRMQPSDAVIPAPFSDCLDDLLWEQDWFALEEGEEVPFVMTFDVQDDADR